MFKRWITLSNKKPVLLMGPRRAGKSTLLKSLYPHYLYKTLDDLDDLEAARVDPKGFIEALGNEFILDGIEIIPAATFYQAGGI